MRQTRGAVYGTAVCGICGRTWPRRWWCFAVGVDPEVGFLGVLKVGGWSVLGATAGLVRIRSTNERVMSVRHRRLAVAGVIAVTAIAVPADRVGVWRRFAIGQTTSG